MKAFDSTQIIYIDNLIYIILTRHRKTLEPVIYCKFSGTVSSCCTPENVTVKCFLFGALFQHILYQTFMWLCEASAKHTYKGNRSKIKLAQKTNLFCKTSSFQPCASSIRSTVCPYIMSSWFTGWTQGQCHMQMIPLIMWPSRWCHVGY